MSVANSTHEMVMGIISEAINLEQHELLQKVTPDWVNVSKFIRTIKKSRSSGVDFSVEYAAIESLATVICAYHGVGVE